MSPVWRRDGKELFYVVPAPTGANAPLEMTAVAITTHPSFSAGTPKALFQGMYQSGGPARRYDVASDGQRFLMVQEPHRPPAQITQVILVENWLEELKTRVQTK
jgi:hypothetical protein